MRLLGVVLSVGLLAVSCSSSSDNPVLRTKATTTTGVPSSTATPVTAPPTTQAPEVLRACTTQMKRAYEESIDWDSEGDAEFVATLEKCGNVETWRREAGSAGLTPADVWLEAGCMLYPGTAVCRDSRGLVPSTSIPPSTAVAEEAEESTTSASSKEVASTTTVAVSTSGVEPTTGPSTTAAPSTTSASVVVPSTASEAPATTIAGTAATPLEATTSTAAPTTTATTTVPTTTTATPTTTTTTTTTVAPTTTLSGDWIEDFVSPLMVSNASAPIDYERDDWGTSWADSDGDCMSARHEVLFAESLDTPVLNYSGCQVTGGRWFAAFTGIFVEDPSGLDIDHFVPLANAHASGGWAWSAATKHDYYNDLSDPQHLIAVTASANRSKGSRGPDEWTPPDTSYSCQYADTWVDIKIRWGLTVTDSELSALRTMLRTCTQASSGGSTGPPVAPATTTTTVATTTTLVPNPGNTKNCSDFATYAEAKVWFDTYYPYYGDVAGLDGDGDGEPCESLPGGPTTTTTTTTTVPPTTTTSGVPDNPGNTKNCSDFSTYSAAKAWFDTFFPYFGDVARLDGDNDGEPCESLPGGP